MESEVPSSLSLNLTLSWNLKKNILLKNDFIFSKKGTLKLYRSKEA